MSIYTSRIVQTCAAAAVVVGGLGATTAPAEASDTWSYKRGGFGYARSCETFRGETLCAVVYCDPGDRGLQVGLAGWEPRGRGDRREGRISVDGRGVDVQYERVDIGPLEPIWRVNARRGVDGVIRGIKAGRTLSFDIAARGRDFDFTLRGSSNAIERLEDQCLRRADARPPRRDDRYDDRHDDRYDDRHDDRYDDRGPRRPDDRGVIRFGDDNFGIELRFGDPIPKGDWRAPRFGPGWERIASERVDHRRDRDVIILGRDEGRFDALRLRATRNDVRLRRIKVRFGNGREQKLDVDHRLSEGRASDIIQLKGRKGRYIDRIELVYESVGRGPRAVLEIWGHRTRG